MSCASIEREIRATEKRLAKAEAAKIAALNAQGAPTLLSVEMTEEADNPGWWRLEAIWDFVDRPNIGGMIVKEALADRIAAAMLDGVWYSNAEYVVDNYGKSYVWANGLTIAKYANSTLAKMGR